jgi:hypothetical protein
LPATYIRAFSLSRFPPSEESPGTPVAVQRLESGVDSKVDGLKRPVI